MDRVKLEKTARLESIADGISKLLRRLEERIEKVDKDMGDE